MGRPPSTAPRAPGTPDDPAFDIAVDVPRAGCWRPMRTSGSAAPGRARRATLRSTTTSPSTAGTCATRSRATRTPAAPSWSPGFTPTTRFLRSGAGGVRQGGLVSLDGVHPTTAGYSIVARECMRVMRDAGVAFYASDGSERLAPELDFAPIADADTLLTRPLRRRR